MNLGANQAAREDAALAVFLLLYDYAMARHRGDKVHADAWLGSVIPKTQLPAIQAALIRKERFR